MSPSGECAAQAWGLSGFQLQALDVDSVLREKHSIPVVTQGVQQFSKLFPSAWLRGW